MNASVLVNERFILIPSQGATEFAEMRIVIILVAIITIITLEARMESPPWADGSAGQLCRSPEPKGDDESTGWRLAQIINLRVGVWQQ